MEKLEKIKKWAKDNGYDFDYKKFLNSQDEIQLSKNYSKRNLLKKIHCYATMEIIYGIESQTLKSRISDYPSFLFNYKEYKRLFIPLNNVKRDEKLLKEYLKNDK